VNPRKTVFRRRNEEEAPASPDTASGDPDPRRDSDLEAVTSLSVALARGGDSTAVARTLLKHVADLLDVEFAAVAVIDEDGRRARGLYALENGQEAIWWRDVSIDFDSEPSAIASAAFEAAPIAVYDVAGSSKVNRRLAEKVGAKSAIFVPLIVEERVPAVLVAASTRKPRVFSAEETALLQALTSEAALALEGARSASALEDALERERLVASISRKVRTEHDLEAVLRIAVGETGEAAGVSRCFIRLAGPNDKLRGSGMPTASSRSETRPGGFPSPTSRLGKGARSRAETSEPTRRSTTPRSVGGRP
jgi:GAF domain-containing protein